MHSFFPLQQPGHLTLSDRSHQRFSNPLGGATDKVLHDVSLFAKSLGVFRDCAASLGPALTPCSREWLLSALRIGTSRRGVPAGYGPLGGFARFCQFPKAGSTVLPGRLESSHC